MRIAVFGGYGCGNLGDGAIFRGMQNCFKDDTLVSIYVNVPNNGPNSIWYADIKLDGFAEKFDKLILGGGGLFHCKNNIADMLIISEKAKLKGIPVEIRGMGCEGPGIQETDLIKKLCSLTDFISVRSNKSKELFESIGVKVNEIQKDFAYWLKPVESKIRVKDLFKNNFPVIGFVSAGNLNIFNLINVLKEITLLPYNIVHIPHCRHYTGRFTNDMVTGEMLFSSIEIYHANRLNQFVVLPFPGSPEELLGIYGQVDKVMGLRFHSFIFADIMEKPLFALVSGLKATSWLLENTGRKNILGCDLRDAKLIGKVKEFLARKT